MPWLRLTLTSRLACTDELGDVLEKFGPEALSFLPASAEPVFGEGQGDAGYWDRTSVSALFKPGIDIEILIACVRNRLGTENVLDCRIESVADEEWTESHKSGFKPLVFNERLCVCPSWSAKPAGIEHVIELDPGLAFGTGTHATTALCLEWLSRHDVAGKDVIDYGCGSGILGIAAARLGARSVAAVDVDPQALQATAGNAEKNGLQDRIHPMLPGDPRMATSDVLIANILMNPLLELTRTFKSLLDGGGSLVLSGLLATQAQACLEAYAPWFQMHAPVYRDEWAMLTGTRREFK